MMLRVGGQLVKGHTARQNGIGIMSLSIPGPHYDLVRCSASLRGAVEGSLEGHLGIWVLLLGPRESGTPEQPLVFLNFPPN